MSELEHPPPTLMDRVRQTARRYGMWRPGERILVAVSGGPDSMALLHVLVQLQKSEGLSLVVAHLNHQLRGFQADEDAEFVCRVARFLSVPAVVEAVPVGELARREGLSVQAAAREARYAFFRRVADAEGLSRMALGHHADDQAETVLFRFLRGTGTRGLAGIPPVRGPIIRPLLEITRDDIMAYCHEYEVPFRDDPSNKDPRYRRNRIRHELIPYLEKHYNARLREGLVRLATLQREEEDFLALTAQQVYHSLANEIFGPSPGPEQPGRFVEAVFFPREGLVGLHPAMQRRVLRMALTRMRMPGNALDWQTIDRIVRHLRGAPQVPEAHLHPPSPTRFDLAGGLYVRLNPEELVLGRSPVPRGEGEAEETGAADGAGGAVGFDFSVAVPGRYHLADPPRQVRLWLESEAAHFRQELSALKRDGSSAGREEETTVLGRWEAVMDWEKVSPPLRLRTRRAGDRFQPLGMEGAKKLQDFMVDAKVPRSLRDQIPLLVDQDGIVCVVGYRIAERVRVTGRTQRLLKVVLRWVDDGDGGDSGDGQREIGMI